MKLMSRLYTRDCFDFLLNGEVSRNGGEAGENTRCELVNPTKTKANKNFENKRREGEKLFQVPKWLRDKVRS